MADFKYLKLHELQTELENIEKKRRDFKNYQERNLGWKKEERIDDLIKLAWARYVIANNQGYSKKIRDFAVASMKTYIEKIKDLYDPLRHKLIGVPEGDSDFDAKGRGKKMTGAGLWDVLKDPIGTIKEAMRDIPSKLNNISQRTVDTYGATQIEAIEIMRTPLNNVLMGALNTISFGQFNKIKEENGYDKLYHLALKFTIRGEKIICEKNEVITIAPFKDDDVNDKTEYFAVSPSPRLNILDMVINTFNRMGATRFYGYDALRGNNCQDFILNMLEANHLSTEASRKFIYQDFDAITKKLDEGPWTSHVSGAVKKITSLGSYVSRLTGAQRKEKKINKKFIEFVNNKGFRFL